MKGLTVKEEELMGYFWEKGPLLPHAEGYREYLGQH